MNFDKLREETNLNEFLEKVEKCKKKCQTNKGIRRLDNLGFKLVDKFLQFKFSDFE
jgi:hypothetical protein